MFLSTLIGFHFVPKHALDSPETSDLNQPTMRESIRNQP